MSTLVKHRNIKIISVLLMVGGLVMAILGGVVWGLVTSQLKEENITIGQDGRFAGRTVAGPLTAFDQADVIKQHSTPGEDSPYHGYTYATLGGLVNEHKAAAIEAAGGDSADPEVVAAINSLNLSKLEQLNADDAVVDATTAAQGAQAQRTTVMNASFLRASLFTSVVSYGVCALVFGLAALFMAIGALLFWGLPKKDEYAEVVVVEAEAAEASA